MSNRQMEPPWLRHPDIPAGSIGWRMGRGEEYYDQFYQWFSALPAGEQAAFRRKYAEPRGWKGFYETIIQNPWLGLR